MDRRVLIAGGGPAGYSAALALRRQGYAVSLVEKASLGGICVNRGCVPTRFYLQAIRRRKPVWLERIEPEEKTEVPLLTDIDTLTKEVEAGIQQLSFGMEYMLRKSGVSIERGEICRIGDKTVTLTDGRTFSCDILILATGSEPVILQNCGSVSSVSVDELLRLEDIPGEISVVGAGVLGTEMAVLLRALGAQVELLEKEADILPGWDGDIRSGMRRYLESLGIRVQTDCTVPGYKKAVFCCGRKPAPGGLLAAAKGKDWIYAIGDAAGDPMTADAAMAEGQDIAARITGGRDSGSPCFARCIFTPLEAASVGAIAAPGMREGYVETANSAAGIVFGCDHGFVKAVVEEETHRIRGFHIVSARASEIIQIGQLAVAQGMTAEEFCALPSPHPTEGELLKEAVRKIL